MSNHLQTAILRQFRFRRPAQPRSRQHGLVLIIALIALVALSLGGIAFMRSVDTSGLIAGNLAFNRAGVAASDAGIEAARAQILAGGFNSWVDQSPGPWYWAQWQNGFDPRSYDWNGAAAVFDPSGLPGAQQAAFAGYDVRYVVHRMCSTAGDPVTSACMYKQVTSLGGRTKGACGYGECPPSDITDFATPYFRITSRIVGPRNTTAYVQVMMY